MSRISKLVTQGYEQLNGNKNTNSFPTNKFNNMFSDSQFDIIAKIMTSKFSVKSRTVLISSYID